MTLYGEQPINADGSQMQYDDIYDNIVVRSDVFTKIVVNVHA